MAANAYRNVFLTNLSNLPANGTVTTGFAIGQIGLIDARTNLAVNTPNFPATRSIQIVQGTADRNLPKGMLFGDQSLRSPEINSNSKLKISTAPAQKPQNMIVTLGYDGVDATKTMSPLVGKDVRVFITLTGQPVANLVGGTGNHPASITETFDLNLPCVSDCTDTCGNTVDCNAVADELIKLIGERKLPGGQLLSKYVKATKVTQCSTPSGVVTTSCNQYQLVVPDTNDQRALGAVQSQYPGVTITRVSFDAPYSTYQATLCPSGTLAAFQADNTPVIPNCSTCPSGYTLSTGDNYAFTIGRTDAGSAAALSTVKSDYSAVVDNTTIIRLSYVNGYSTYQAYGSSATTPLSLGIAGDLVLFIGAVQLVCKLTSAGLTYPWVSTGITCKLAQEVWTITVADSVCGVSALADLQAVYGSGVSQIASGLCVHQFALTVNSDAPQCETCSDQDYTFTAPQPFGRSFWVPPVVPVQDGEGSGCVCGVRLESAYVARDRAECYFQEVSYEVEPLFLWVSSQNPDFRDYSTLCNDLETFPVTLIQNAKYAQGFGSFVADQVKLSKFYFNDPWFEQPVVRDAIGYQLGVDLQGYYDDIILEWYAPIEGSQNVSGFGSSQFEFYEYHIYAPAGQATAFLNAINAWAVSIGSQPATI